MPDSTLSLNKVATFNCRTLANKVVGRKKTASIDAKLLVENRLVLLTNNDDNGTLWLYSDRDLPDYFKPSPSNQDIPPPITESTDC
uniref:Transposase n=1 Tax=Rhabditophanes sp. KR3021 TaxID=114890 RepID=A0AC35TIM1_9BILA